MSVEAGEQLCWPCVSDIDLRLVSHGVGIVDLVYPLLPVLVFVLRDTCLALVREVLSCLLFSIQTTFVCMHTLGHFTGPASSDL